MGLTVRYSAAGVGVSTVLTWVYELTHSRGMVVIEAMPPFDAERPHSTQIVLLAAEGGIQGIHYLQRGGVGVDSAVQCGGVGVTLLSLKPAL